MSEDVTGSEMSSSVNSDASYDIDIVRHHDGESLAWSAECPLSSALINSCSRHLHRQPAGRQRLLLGHGLRGHRPQQTRGETENSERASFKQLNTKHKAELQWDDISRLLARRGGAASSCTATRAFTRGWACPGSSCRYHTLSSECSVDNDDVPVQVSDVCPLPPVQEETQHPRSSSVATTRQHPRDHWPAILNIRHYHVHWLLPIICINCLRRHPLAWIICPNKSWF